MDISNWQLHILDYIQDNFRHVFLDVIIPPLSFLGELGWFWLVLALAFCFNKKWRRQGVRMLFAAAFCGIGCNLFLKPLVARPRPFALRPQSYPGLVDFPSEFSFPSGHSTVSFSAACSLFDASLSFIYYASLVLALLIALTRLYLYVHYPTDIIIGAAMGFLNAWIADKLIIMLERRSKHFASFINGSEEASVEITSKS